MLASCQSSIEHVSIMSTLWRAFQHLHPPCNVNMTSILYTICQHLHPPCNVESHQSSIENVNIFTLHAMSTSHQSSIPYLHPQCNVNVTSILYTISSPSVRCQRHINPLYHIFTLYVMSTSHQSSVPHLHPLCDVNITSILCTTSSPSMRCQHRINPLYNMSSFSSSMQCLSITSTI